MLPLNGEKLVRDYSRLTGVTREAGFAAVERDGWIHSTLQDGQTGAGAAAPSERSDGQLGGIPYGATRRNRARLRFHQLPTQRTSTWCVMGPFEIHAASGALLAPLMPSVTPGGRWTLDTPNQATAYVHDLTDDDPATPDGIQIELGREYRVELVVRYHMVDGFIRMWIDGDLVWREDGKIAPDTAAGYWKWAHYRDAKMQGPSEWSCRDGTITEPATRAAALQPAGFGDLTGGGDPAPDPLPPSDPTPTPTPSVRIISPQRGATITNTHVAITCQTQHAPPGATVYLGVAGGNHRQLPAADAVMAAVPATPGDRWVYAALHVAGEKVAGDNIPVTVAAPPPPPPPDPDPPPVDVAAVKQQLQAARAALNAAEQLLQ